MATEIFHQNHLSYVISSEENVRNYLIEALNIDTKFIEKFSIHDCISALEHTLHFRPETVPTEVYLKSQRLWIMHKLLMRVPEVREKIQVLLNSPTPESMTLSSQLRVPMSQLLVHFQQRVAYTDSPVFSIIDDLNQGLNDFFAAHQAGLQQEKKVYVERRCEIIRWFSWLICEHGREWLSQADNIELQEGLAQWMKNPQTFISPSASLKIK